MYNLVLSLQRYYRWFTSGVRLDIIEYLSSGEVGDTVSDIFSRTTFNEFGYLNRNERVDNQYVAEQQTFPIAIVRPSSRRVKRPS